MSNYPQYQSASVIPFFTHDPTFILPMVAMSLNYLLLQVFVFNHKHLVLRSSFLNKYQKQMDTNSKSPTGHIPILFFNSSTSILPH